MGQYRSGRYYRGRDDADLQWLEDGVGLIGKIFVFSALSCIIGIVQLICIAGKHISGNNKA